MTAVIVEELPSHGWGIHRTVCAGLNWNVLLNVLTKILVCLKYLLRDYFVSTGEPVVRSTKPYTRVDMNRIPLPNFIRDYTITTGEKDPVNPLNYLYPDIPRDVAFGRYYTSASDGIW